MAFVGPSGEAGLGGWGGEGEEKEKEEVGEGRGELLPAAMDYSPIS